MLPPVPATQACPWAQSQWTLQLLVVAHLPVEESQRALLTEVPAVVQVPSPVSHLGVRWMQPIGESWQVGLPQSRSVLHLGGATHLPLAESHLPW